MEQYGMLCKPPPTYENIDELFADKGRHVGHGWFWWAYRGGGDRSHLSYSRTELERQVKAYKRYRDEPAWKYQIVRTG